MGLVAGACWFQTSLGLTLVAGWAGPEASLRHVRQAWPAGSKKQFNDFRQKWTHGAGRRRAPKISRPAGQDFGPADMGGGVQSRIVVVAFLDSRLPTPS